MTRFGGNSPFWQSFCHFFEGLLSIWQIDEPTLAKNYAICQIFIAINVPILNKYSSHLFTLLPIEQMIRCRSLLDVPRKSSVTRLGDLCKFLATNCLAKVAQIFGDFLAYY